MKTVILDGYTLNPGDNPWTGLEEICELDVHDRTEPDQIIERAADAEIILTNKTVLSAEIINALPNLKFIAGAALDVVENEPMLPGNPLSGSPNLTITPHIAWATLEARSRLTATTVANVMAFMNGKAINVVNGI